jgi:hypothetical protein
MARGIEDQARKLGYLVIICSTDDQTEVLARYTPYSGTFLLRSLFFSGSRAFV